MANPVTPLLPLYLHHRALDEAFELTPPETVN